MKKALAILAVLLAVMCWLNAHDREYAFNGDNTYTHAQTPLSPDADILVNTADCQLSWDDIDDTMYLGDEPVTVQAEFDEYGRSRTLTVEAEFGYFNFDGGL